MRISILVSIAFLGFSNLLFAQDPQFTQHFSTGIYNNPAFTGSAGKAKLNAAYRNRWPNITFGGNEGGFHTYFISFDISNEKLPFDIGIFSLHDRANGGDFNTTQTGLSVGRSFKIYKNMSLRIGLSGALANRSLKSLNPYPGSSNIPEMYSINYAVINYGMVLNSNTILLGFSANNLNQPNRNFFSENGKSPINYVAQGAVRVTMNSAENLNGLYLSVFLTKQAEYSNFLPGLIYRYKFLKAGISTNVDDSYAFNAAYSAKNLCISYSFIKNISKLTNILGFSNEINLNWTFGKLNEKRPGIGFISSLF